MSDGKVQYEITLKDRASAILRRISGGFGKFFRGIRGMAGGAMRMLTGLPALLAGGGIAAAIGKSIHSFGIQEAATNDLHQALILMGDGSEETLKKLTNFSSELQGMSRVGDEASQKMMALGLNLKVPIDRIEETTEAALGLSKRLGIDATAAMQLLARMAAGGEVALSRYGITIDKNLSPQEKFNELLKFGAEGFAAVKSDAEKTAGKFVQFKNAVGDLWERLGQAINKVFHLGSVFDGLRKRVEKINFERIAKGLQVVVAVLLGVSKAAAWVWKRLAAIGKSDAAGKLAAGFKVVVGMIKGLASGTLSFSKILGELGGLLGASLKLGFLQAVNFLAKALQSTVSAFTVVLGASMMSIAKVSFWTGLAQIIIGSLASVGAFLIKIFTEPLVMLQAGVDTIIKGMFNKLAGAGGKRDEFGTGRLGRKLGIAVQENDYDKNLEEARKNSWLVKQGQAGAAAGQDILAAGLAKVSKAMDPGLAGAMKQAITDNMKGEDLFDIGKSKKKLSDAADVLAVYGQDIKLSPLKLKPDASAKTSPGTTPPKSKTHTAGNNLAAASKAKKSEIDMLSRSEWMRSVRGGRTPEDLLVDNTREIKDTLKRIEKNTGGLE